MMKRSFALFAAIGMLSSVAALAGPPKQKIVDVWTCPIAMQAVANHNDAKGVVVANKYRVHFCCGGCPEEFAKLSDKDKLAKATAAYRADQAKKSDKKS